MKIFWTNLAFELFKIDKFYDGAAWQLHKQHADEERRRLKIEKLVTDDLKLKGLNPGIDVSRWNKVNCDMANTLLGAARLMTARATMPTEVEMKAHVALEKMDVPLSDEWLVQLNKRINTPLAIPRSNTLKDYENPGGIPSPRERMNLGQRALLYADFARLFGQFSTDKKQRTIKSGDCLRFRVVCEGKERQVRIYLGDPVTLCEITSKNSVSFGYTKRNPKDQWNARVAAMESLKNALNSFGYEKESREIIYRKLLAKYPELKG